MKNYFFSFVLLFAGFFLHAQIYDQTIIHAGDDLPAYFTYRFPVFEDAVVKFKDGRYLVSKMNYNMLLSKMQFISPKGDTLELLKTENVDSIRISRSVFYYNSGSYEMFAASDSAKLVVFRKTSFEPVKTGAMGRPAHGTSADSYTDLLTVAGVNKQLTVNEDIYVNKETIYFLIDVHGEMLKANKSNFIKIFPGNKKHIDDFIRKYKINIDRLGDLEKLFQFCISDR